MVVSPLSKANNHIARPVWCPVSFLMLSTARNSNGPPIVACTRTRSPGFMFHGILVFMVFFLSWLMPGTCPAGFYDHEQAAEGGGDYPTEQGKFK